MARPNNLRTLVGEQRLIYLTSILVSSIELTFLMDQNDALLCRHVPQALVTCRHGQPGADAFWVLDPIDMLDQPHPCRLHHIGRIALRKLEPSGDRPD